MYCTWMSALFPYLRGELRHYGIGSIFVAIGIVTATLTGMLAGLAPAAAAARLAPVEALRHE